MNSGYAELPAFLLGVVITVFTWFCVSTNRDHAFDAEARRYRTAERVCEQHGGPEAYEASFSVIYICKNGIRVEVTSDVEEVE